MTNDKSVLRNKKEFYRMIFMVRLHESVLVLNVPLIIEPPHDKTNKMTVHPAKAQNSLGIRPV